MGYRSSRTRRVGIFLREEGRRKQSRKGGGRCNKGFIKKGPLIKRKKSPITSPSLLKTRGGELDQKTASCKKGTPGGMIAFLHFAANGKKKIRKMWHRGWEGGP